MSYPKPIPSFTPDAFHKTIALIEDSTVPEKEIAAVGEIREEIRCEREK